MKPGLSGPIVTAGIAVILLTGCVSSRKYKASQNALATARTDSAQLAHQVDSLNGNVRNWQDKNTAMQRSLDSASSSYATQQKSLDYYQGYFKDQHNMLSQVSDEVKGALTQAGVANGDVQQVDNTVYIRLDGNELFKKNSAVVTPTGKQALDNLAQVIRSRSNVNVFVGSDDSSTASGAVAMNNESGSMSNEGNAPSPRHRKHAHTVARSTTADASTGASVASNNSATHAPRKVHHKYSSERSMAFNSGMPYSHNHAWALKQGRSVAVANHFLKNGMSKVNVTLRQPSVNGDAKNNTIKVVIMPTMKDFNPQMNSSTGAQPKQVDAASN